MTSSVYRTLTPFIQLATQMYATICYLSQRHPLLAPAQVPGDPWTIPPPQDQLKPGNEDTDPANPRALRPDSPATFASSQRELAEDLVWKGVQIEELITRLPGSGTREEEQEARIDELAGQLKDMEKRRKAKRQEMRRLVERLDHVVMGVASSGGVVMNGSGSAR